MQENFVQISFRFAIRLAQGWCYEIVMFCRFGGRGRGRGRGGRGRGRGRGAKAPAPTADELDAELDAYKKVCPDY